MAVIFFGIKRLIKQQMVKFCFVDRLPEIADDMMSFPRRPCE